MEQHVLNLDNKHITVWGLGLHGGGVASCKFCASRGAKVTVLDNKPRELLQPSIEKLKGYDITFCLGKEDRTAIASADIVIKNPAIPRSHPLLSQARRVETDLSLFFRGTHPKLIAITGTKGKSTTSALIYHVLAQTHPSVAIAGNSTDSPLALDTVPETLIMEISSFQLGDLQYVQHQKEAGPLPPVRRLQADVAILTNLYPDHLNYYPSMAEYAEDKRLLFHWQTEHQHMIAHHSCKEFLEKEPGIPSFFSSSPLKESEAWIDKRQLHFRTGNQVHGISSREFLEGGMTPRLLSAAAASLALHYTGVDVSTICRAIPRFPGLPHRLEYLGTHRDVTLYNDSASTIPESTLSSVSSFQRPVHLITGGTNKNLDFKPFAQIAAMSTSIHLLWGSASDHILPFLQHASRTYTGPVRNVEEALDTAMQLAQPHDIILFSPGAASFELYDNEFARGDHFRQLVQSLSEADHP